MLGEKQIEELNLESSYPKSDLLFYTSWMWHKGFVSTSIVIGQFTQTYYYVTQISHHVPRDKKLHKYKNPYNRNVSKLVGTSHGIVVQHSRGCNPTRVCVICKYYQLIFLALISHKMEALLNVTHYQSVTHRIQSYDEIRNVLKTENNKATDSRLE